MATAFGSARSSCTRLTLNVELRAKKKKEISSFFLNDAQLGNF